MKVSINILDHTDEYDLILNIQNEDIELNRKEWYGSISLDNEKHYIQVHEMPSGVLHKLIKSEHITSEDYLIENQINAQLLENVEATQMGFEATENHVKEEPIPYDPKQIKIRNENWSIKLIFELINEYNDIDLFPDFQREFIWDTKRKSRLIESLMLGIPIPAFYLAENTSGKMHVVDGLQRLNVISDFMNNKFSLRHLEYIGDEANGFYFDENKADRKKGISWEYKKRILQTQINVNIIESSSPLKVKYDVFRRINTGGKPLNNQEIRNCLAESNVRNFINELAKSTEFKEATGYSVKTTRMDAQELVLRFIGFYLIKKQKSLNIYYKGGMQSFLDDLVGVLNFDLSKYENELREAFYNAMKNSLYLFSQYAFRKCLPRHLEPNAYRQLINKSLFTTWSVSLADISYHLISDKITKGSFAKVLATDLEENPDNLMFVSTNTNDKVFLEKAFQNTINLIENNIN